MVMLELRDLSKSPVKVVSIPSTKRIVLEAVNGNTRIAIQGGSNGEIEIRFFGEYMKVKVTRQ